MAFKRKEDGGGGDTIKFGKVGDKVTGIYLGSQPFDKGKFGPCLKHIFKTEKGLKVAFAKQESQMSGILNGEDGKLVTLTFDSTKPSGKGNPTKLYTLDIDDEYEPTQEELSMESEEGAEDDTPSDEVQTSTTNRTAPVVNRRAVNNVLKQRRVN